MIALLSSILVTLFVSTVIGWDPSQIDCSKTPLCLTSFKWCDPRGRDGCYYPDGVYPPGANTQAGIYALLVENKNFTISWKVLDARDKDTPVRVRWALTQEAIWDTNTTDSQVTFNPGDILTSFPLSSAPNVSEAYAGYQVLTNPSSVITIDQPDINSRRRQGNGGHEDMSDQFILGTSYFIEHFLEAQNRIGHQDEYKKWKLGVGIGVGLGVPILMAITALGTWMALRKKMQGVQKTG